MIRLPPLRLSRLALELGGTLESARGGEEAHGLCALGDCAETGASAIVPILRALRGAAPAEGILLVQSGVAALDSLKTSLVVWRHPHASYVVARLLERAQGEQPEPELGTGVELGKHVVLERGVRLGDRVKVGHGSVIGSRGFGWVSSPEGAALAMPHLGGVRVEADVSLGALVTIDAGVLAPTRIGRGTKIDAHCHVGHNVVIGEDCFLAAQTGIAGSTRIGNRVRMGGQVGIADHLEIGDGAEIAAKSGVISDIPAGSVYAGYPARPRMEWLRAAAVELRGRGA